MGIAVPSCYRVSVLSGSLEVSARLKNADDLELEANKALFAKADRLEPEAKTDRPAIKLSTAQSETHVVARAGRPKTKTSAKANGSLSKILAEVDQPEPEILTLT